MDSSLALRENIKRLMVRKGFSQKTLANNSGVSQKTISNLVANNGVLKSPAVSTVESIASGLGVSPAELLGYESTGATSAGDDPYIDLSNLIRDFMAADSEGRRAILRVARNEAIHAKQI